MYVEFPIVKAANVELPGRMEVWNGSCANEPTIVGDLYWHRMPKPTAVCSRNTCCHLLLLASSKSKLSSLLDAVEPIVGIEALGWVLDTAIDFVLSLEVGSQKWSLCCQCCVQPGSVGLPLCSFCCTVD